MTVSQAIATLLSENGKIEIDKVYASDGADQNGLCKKPEREVKNLIDGAYEITEQYSFAAKQKVLAETEKMETDAWLEELIYWVDDLAYCSNFPELGSGRKIISMEMTGKPYSIAAEDNETIYQMSLSVTYTREREDTLWKD